MCVDHKHRAVINMLQRYIEEATTQNTHEQSKRAPNNFITTSHLHYWAVVSYVIGSTNELTTNTVQASFFPCCSIYFGLSRVKLNSKHGERVIAGAEVSGKRSGEVSYFMEFIVFNKGRVMICLGDIPRLPARRCSATGGASAAPAHFYITSVQEIALYHLYL